MMFASHHTNAWPADRISLLTCCFLSRERCENAGQPSEITCPASKSQSAQGNSCQVCFQTTSKRCIFAGLSWGCLAVISSDLRSRCSGVRYKLSTSNHTRTSLAEDLDRSTNADSADHSSSFEEASREQRAFTCFFALGDDPELPRAFPQTNPSRWPLVESVRRQQTPLICRHSVRIRAVIRRVSPRRAHDTFAIKIPIR